MDKNIYFKRIYRKEPGSDWMSVEQRTMMTCDRTTQFSSARIFGKDRETMEEYLVRTHEIVIPDPLGLCEHGETYEEAWDKLDSQLRELGVTVYKKFVSAPKGTTVTVQELIKWGHLKESEVDGIPQQFEGTADDWFVGVKWFKEDQCQIQDIIVVPGTKIEEAKDE